jgi:hypothetical protein
MDNNDNMVWGKGYWLLIWNLLYDEVRFPNLIEVKQYLDLVTRNLPCSDCREHVKVNIKNYNIMSSTDRKYIQEFFIAVYNKTARHQILDPKIVKTLNEKFNQITN